MAKPKLQKNGTWTITVTHNYDRRNLTLGKIDRRDAAAFAANLEILSSSIKHSFPPSVHLQAWIASLSRTHKQQLSELGLLTGHDSTITVSKLIAEFMKDYRIRLLRKEIRSSSVTQFECAMLRFPKYFKDKKLIDIEPKRRIDRINSEPVFSIETKELFTKVESWQREHYQIASWARANGRLREVGKWAVKQGICDHNPFSMLQSPKSINKERNLEVKRQWVLDAMEQCLHPDIRLLWVLARFCGLRMLSEARTIRPADIDFDGKMFRILDSKKREYRTMPLFNLVEKELRQHQQQVDWGQFVLSPFVLRSTNQCATKQMKLAAERAGVKIWCKFHQNMRSSCENDLLRQGFDERQVTLWMGHTIAISRDHYQKQFEADYQAAVYKSSYQSGQVSSLSPAIEEA